MNIRRPRPYDADDDLLEGRRDLQSDAHRFFNEYLRVIVPKGTTILDIGSGQGRIRERLDPQFAARLTCHDVDARLLAKGWVDVVGPQPPEGQWDFVTAFDVIEHVEDDKAFLEAMSSRAKLGIFLTTPNWLTTRCNEAKGGSTHHWREYLDTELLGLAQGVLPPGAAFLLAFYKDASGGWWSLPRTDALGPTRRKHGLLWVADGNLVSTTRAFVGATDQPHRTPA